MESIKKLNGLVSNMISIGKRLRVKRFAPDGVWGLKKNAKSRVSGCNYCVWLAFYFFTKSATLHRTFAALRLVFVLDHLRNKAQRNQIEIDEKNCAFYFDPRQ